MCQISPIRVFCLSMHDLDSGRTPMWSFGRTTLRDRWIPVGSLRQHKGGKRHSHNPNADNGVLAALRQPSQGRWCGLGGSRLTDRTSRKAASVRMYAGCARVAAGLANGAKTCPEAKACRPVVAARSSGSLLTQGLRLRKRHGSPGYMKVFVVARRRGESRRRRLPSWPLARCGQACHAFPRSDGSPAAHGGSICHFARP